MDLDRRTLDTLDWPAVVAAVGLRCRTLRGAAAGLPLARDRDGVRLAYAGVAEIQALEEQGESLPIGAISDILGAVERAATGAVLEPEELHGAGRCLQALEHLRCWVQERDLPVLQGLCAPIDVDAMMLEELVASFDEGGQLSDQRYPELGELRRRIQSFHGQIRTTLSDLLKAKDMEGILQDRFVTQRGDRYVIPVRAEARRKGLGIVHDTSGSGETVFVEPAAVVELNNKLRLAEGELQRSIARILRGLSALLGRYQVPVEASLEAAVGLDLVQARAKLGADWQGVLPEVGRGGVIRLVGARHPVLVLREVEVVPNDLALDETTRGLVLSGPNTGGKTIALKTLGSFALLTRAGVPLPATEARVDHFEDVLADIGDLQSVEGDLSTFSGQVLVLRELLDRARPGALLLLDEVAVGTDPAQGSALARAVLEVLVDRGARVAVTTHYTELKAFAEADPRFRNAAVHLEDNRPSYRVRLDAVGLSHAFSTARRLGLDPAVVDAAEAHLDDNQREVGRLLEELETRRVTTLLATERALELEASVRQREQQLRARWEQIQGKSHQLAEKEATAALSRLRAAEDEVKAIIATLQRNPTLQGAGQDLAEVRRVQERIAPQKPEVPVIVDSPGSVSPGDRVRVRSLGKTGRVLTASKKGRAEVDIGGLRTRVKLNDLVLLDAPKKAANKASVRSSEPTTGDLRTERNTCDLRGLRADEALDAVERFLDRMVLANEPVGWILHGHGTGALKTAVRRWLPSSAHAESWRPAGENEGGDAFTRVAL